MDATSRESFSELQLGHMLFGFIGIGLGMITKNQLDECLETQKQGTGSNHRLGDIMLDKGYLTSDQIQKILSIQQRD